MNGLRKYISFFRIRFYAGLQYRAAALAGVATQFAWGLLTLLLFLTFYEGNPDAFPMEMQETAAYIWLRQSFFALFNLYAFDSTIFEAITSGGVAYELTRPMDLYSMWFTKNAALRVSRTMLRFWPILVLAVLIPAPYSMMLPASLAALVGFVVSLLLGVSVACAFLMIIYDITFYTMQPQGVRLIFVSATELLCGDLIPLPFFPSWLARPLSLTPFAAMSNVPYRVYSGNIAGAELWQSIGLQVFWLLVLVALGRCLMNRALARVAVQGG